MIVLGQKWLYSGKLDLLGQKWFYSGNRVFFRADLLCSEKSGGISVK